MNKLFAIWKYDAFPYFLGGEVIELKSDGWVTIVGYDGMKFKYSKLYPLEEGKDLYNKAMLLNRIHREKTQQLSKDYLKEIKETMAI